jgi:hypothetical protein
VLTGPDELPPTLVFDYPSVAAIADFVLTLLPAALTPPLQPQPPAQHSAAAVDASGQHQAGAFSVFSDAVNAAYWLLAVQQVIVVVRCYQAEHQLAVLASHSAADSSPAVTLLRGAVLSKAS